VEPNLQFFYKVNKVVPTLQKIQGLAAEDAFGASEKVLIGTILNNISEKNFEPIGFLDIPSNAERDACVAIRTGAAHAGGVERKASHRH
jgi:hypothetical protein